MPRFSANISTLFREYPFDERISRAASVGFSGIEIQFPYDENPADLQAELKSWNLPLVLMNFPVGDLITGGEGLAAIPGRERDFEQALLVACEYAEILRPRAMNLLAGRPSSHHDQAQCNAVFKANLRKAYAVTQELGIGLVTEPVNIHDSPGFFLSGSQQTLELINATPEIELSMQYDIYHMHIMESNVMKRLPKIIDQIGHIQFSDAPGRTEPGLGEIDFEQIFNLIDALDYKGYVGAEYFPTAPTQNTLDWLKLYRKS